MSPRKPSRWGAFLPVSASMEIHHSEKMMTDGIRFFTIVRFSGSDGRIVHQMFYRTSGHNTGVKDTWFPCDGLMVDEHTGQDLFVKLSQTNFSRALSAREDLLQKIARQGIDGLTDPSAIRTGLLMRFGTPDYAACSRLLGGGLWNTTIGIVLCEHLGLGDDTGTVVLDPAAKMMSTDQSMNEFVAWAVSTNSYPEEYATRTVSRCNPFRVDLREWYKKTLDIGSGLAYRKRFRGGECNRHVSFRTSEKKIPVFCLYNDLTMMGCDVFDGLMKIARANHERFRAGEEPLRLLTGRK
ncbi:hypothetical protein EBZ80_03530 [bacterium]|nr:hypothetical protein [bacterium]